MSFRRSVAAVVAVFGLGGFATTAHAELPATYTIAPALTDPAITDTTPSRGSHLVWLGPAQRRAEVNRLLVFLPTGGPTNLPSEFEELGTEAAGLGYHTIVLAYRNEAPIAAPPPAGCGNFVEAPDSPKDCAITIRREILDGTDPVVVVDKAGSIQNRLDKLLRYLVAAHPGDGWAQFLTTSGEPVWSKTVIAGASLGAGQAAIIAERHAVARVALLHGWSDAAHGWVTRNATPSDRYHVLIHARENFFARTCEAYRQLGIAPSCPLTGFTLPPVLVDPANPLFVENRRPPFGSQLLVHNIEPFTLAGVNDPYHSSTTRDGWIPREGDGTPSLKLVNAWRSVLGDSDADTRLDQADNCPQVANAEQVDSDANGVGDACGPTFAAGTVGGSVAATLALALGPPATFGTFTPGVDRTYDATTTATVTSTAGDATLTVADAATTAAGHLVNGAFSLAEPLGASAGGASAPLGSAPVTLLTFAGPVSNRASAIAFRQHIGAAEALRTGTYTKTLTFTLATTAP